MRTAGWISANPYKTRHHKKCAFNLFYVPYDPSKLKTKKKWREADDADDDKDDEKEADDEGDDNEKAGKKSTPKDASDEKPDDDEAQDDVKEQPKKPKTGKPAVGPFTPPSKKVPTTGGPNIRRPPPDMPKKPKVVPKKGEWYPEFGVYVERPMFIQTNLGSDKYLDVVANKLVIKT